MSTGQTGDRRPIDGHEVIQGDHCLLFDDAKLRIAPEQMGSIIFKVVCNPLRVDFDFVSTRVKI